jgi:tetratricopeptide (TPR) repeat protein
MKNMLFVLVLCGSAGLWAQQPAAGSKQTQPPAKHVAQAKTAQEFKDYNTAYALTGGEALEKAADDFAAKYPASELKIFLYEKAMHEYQAANNQAKILATGRKVLQLDPDNAIALVLSANVLSDNLTENDPDQQKAVEVNKYASHALEILSGNYSPTANATPEQIEAYKRMLQGLAHSALGITALKMHDYAGAEKELRAAVDANLAQPDPFVWFHLALAQDRQEKYPDALVSVNRAMDSAASNPDIMEKAKDERQRLMVLTRSSGSSAPK